MIHIIVVDDNKDLLLLIEKMIDTGNIKWEYSLMLFSDAVEFAKYCKKEEKIDIVLVDIELGKYNGVNIASDLKDYHKRLLYIYMSAFDSHYAEIVHGRPFEFLRKPFDGEQLIDILNSAYKQIVDFGGADNPRIYQYKSNRVNIQIGLEQVFYFSSDLKRIYCKSVNRCDYFYDKLDNVEIDVYEICDYFVRVNKSFLVNKKYISQISSKKLVVDNEEIVIGRKYIENLFEFIN